MSPDIWEKVSKQLSLMSTIKEFRGEFAVLVLETGGSEVLWPTAYLPSEAKVGDQVPLTVGNGTVSEPDRIRIAQKILEELVN